MTNGKNKWLLVFVLTITLLAPLFTVTYNFCSVSSNKDTILDTDLLNVQSFSKDDFTPVIDDKTNGLGTITINEINFGNLGIGFHLNSDIYPLLNKVYNTNALNMTFEGIKYVDTVMPAMSDNIDENITYREQISVTLNETINVYYNTTESASQGYLIYRPRLYNCTLSELYVVKEGSSVIDQVDEVNYSIDAEDFLYFDYQHYFSGNDVLNFTMYLIWECNFALFGWEASQYAGVDIPIREQEEEITPEFVYSFYFYGGKYSETSNNDFSENPIESPAIEILANITVNPLDKNLFYDYKLEIENTPIDEAVFNSSYLNPDNSITVGELNATVGLFNLSFKLDYTLKFIDPVQDSWSVDRLYSQRDIRERIYFPSITSGPTYIYIENLKIFERTITIDQYLGHTSLFSRESSISCKNASIYEWESDPELTTNNVKEQQGLNITLPYLIKGEICPFSIKYNATDDLKIIVMDNIGMPLIGLTVKVYYYGKSYGTYISNENNQPIATQTTDENAEILLKNVPSGYYEIKIYQYGILQVTTTVSTYKENLLITSIVHFPLWILLFGLFSLSIFVIGYRLHQKNKKR